MVLPLELSFQLSDGLPLLLRLLRLRFLTALGPLLELDAEEDLREAALDDRDRLPFFDERERLLLSEEPPLLLRLLPTLDERERDRLPLLDERERLPLSDELPLLLLLRDRDLLERVEAECERDTERDLDRLEDREWDLLLELEAERERLLSDPLLELGDRGPLSASLLVLAAPSDVLSSFSAISLEAEVLFTSASDTLSLSFSSLLPSMTTGSSRLASI